MATETHSPHLEIPAGGAAVESTLAMLERAAAELRATSGEQLRLLREVCEAGACRVPLCTQAQCLRAAIVEAIAVLDATRSSFKSRQLEALRKRLLEVLGSD